METDGSGKESEEDRRVYNKSCVRMKERARIDGTGGGQRYSYAAARTWNHRARQRTMRPHGRRPWDHLSVTKNLPIQRAPAGLWRAAQAALWARDGERQPRIHKPAAHKRSLSIDRPGPLSASVIGERIADQGSPSWSAPTAPLAPSVWRPPYGAGRPTRYSGRSGRRGHTVADLGSAPSPLHAQISAVSSAWLLGTWAANESQHDSTTVHKPRGPIARQGQFNDGSM
jgi:hypothetical protein